MQTRSQWKLLFVFLRTEFEANENLTGKKSANQTRKQSLYITIQMTCKVQIIMC